MLDINIISSRVQQKVKEYLRKVVGEIPRVSEYYVECLLNARHYRMNYKYSRTME